MASMFQFEHSAGRRKILAGVYAIVGVPFVLWLWVMEPGSTWTMVGTAVPLSAIMMLLLVRSQAWWGWVYPFGFAPLLTCLAGANVIGYPALFMALLMGPAGLSGLHDDPRSVFTTWLCCSVGFGVLGLRGDSADAGLGLAGVAMVMHLCISAVVFLEADRLRISTATAQTARRQADEALLVAKEASASRERLMASMTHELRTPLVGIIGMVDLLPPNADVATVDTLGTIRRSADSLLHVVNDLLLYAKGRSGTLTFASEPFAPAAMLRDAARFVGSQATSKGLELFIEIEPTVPASMRSDELRLRQVVMNLLGNAIKFTEKGSVTLRAAVDPVLSRLHITIVDTGIGINEAQVARIFEPFVQADESHSRQYGGTGLGLWIAKDFVERLGGHISCVSSPGAGSAFSFWLPVEENDLRQPHAKPPAWLTKKMVGIAAGTDVAFRHLASLIERQGARVVRLPTSASWGSLALDLVVVDLPSPDSQACVGRVPSGVPVVALAPLADLRFASSVVAIEKPYADDELSAACHRALLLSSAPVQLNEYRAQEVSPALGPAGLQFDLLVVEDNPINARVAVGLLSRAGHRVSLALNGREALRLVDTQPFDAVIMDMQMPEMDGLEATRALRQRGLWGLPVIVVSANAFEEDEQRARQAGADAFCSKPFNLTRIQSLLAALVQPKLERTYARPVVAQAI
jgi:signal transduction histidine kinase/CheY-like chemotaxis protein